MRAFPRWLVLLVVAAAAVSAALSHVVIDIIADYLVPHASFDDVGSHGSRELIVAIAVAAAGIIAVRGFRLCCEAAARRARAPEPPRWSVGTAFVLATVALASPAVPAMEWIDTLWARRPLDGLDDAFGGSVALGLITTVICAGIVAFATFAFVRWLLSHRHQIIAAIAAIICKTYATPPSAAELRTFATVPVRRRSIASLRRGKRGPPRIAVSSTQLTHTAHEDLHVTHARCGVLPHYRQRSHAVRGRNRPGWVTFLRSQSA